MKAIRRLDLELNELGWLANWGSLEWLGPNAYLLSSRGIPELFFNRGGVTSCTVPVAAVAWIEKKLDATGRPPVVTVFESCEQARTNLSRAGYEIADRMIVMEAKNGVHLPEGPSVSTKKPSSAEKWSRAYLSAFYGELNLLPVTRGIVEKLGKMDKVTLLEADVGGTVAGVTALYQTEGLLGAYGVGTVPRFRRRGVGGALLKHASDIASSEGRSLILQTLESDRAQRFYERRGFRAVYAKVLMKKKGY